MYYFKSKMSAAATMVWLTLMLTMLTGCAKSKLRSGIDELNKSCPIQISMFGRMMGADYDGDCVTMRYEMDDRVLKFEGFRENAELSKKMVLDYCKNQKEFVSALLDAGASLKFVYEGRLSGESFSMEISRDELRQALQGEVMSAQEKMEISIIIANAQTPMQLVEGITMTAMQQEGDCVYYIYEVTPEAFANIESNLNEVKDNVRYMLGQLGEVEKNDLRNIPNANKNLGYRYTCPDTGQSVEFFFTQSQLIDILR